MILDATPGGLANAMGYGSWKQTTKQQGEFTLLRVFFQCGQAQIDGFCNRKLQWKIYLAALWGLVGGCFFMKMVDF